MQTGEGGNSNTPGVLYSPNCGSTWGSMSTGGPELEKERPSKTWGQAGWEPGWVKPRCSTFVKLSALTFKIKGRTQEWISQDHILAELIWWFSEIF